MRLVVQKFGGTSVANATRIKEAARKAIRAKHEGNQVLVVVSARGDRTDELIELAKQVTEKSPPDREMDMLLATGEQESIALLAMAIDDLGEPAISFTGAQVGIVTDKTHRKARIKTIDTLRVREALQAGNIVIVAGFQGIDEKNNITTLGRGGSDTTAVALAAVLKHDPGRDAAAIVDCEIYTDVDGIYTTDPRIVPDARKIDRISYDEMLELASAGAGVMHSRSIEFASKFDVPIQVRSSFSDVQGTWIVPAAGWMKKQPVCGAALVRDEARVAIIGVPNQPGISHSVFEAMAKRNIVVDMIAQNVGSHDRADIGFTVPKDEVDAALQQLRPLADNWGARVEANRDMSKVSIVGIGMSTDEGVAARMFAALAKEKISIKMITTADIKISVLVSKRDGIRALRAVHNAFGLAQPRPGAGLPAPSDPDPADASRATSRGLATLTTRLANMEDIEVTEVGRDDNQGRITVAGLPDDPGSYSRIFEEVAEAGIVVDMIIQNTTASRPELSFSVPRVDLQRALAVTQKEARSIAPDAEVSADPDIANVYVVGVGMRTHGRVATRMFGVLAERGINIGMINTSEIRLSVVVERAQGAEAEECLRNEFLA